MQPATTTILSLAEEPDEHASSQQAPYPSSFPGTIEPVALGKTSAINATLDLRHAYIDTLSRFVDINLIQRATMTLFVDPMHGATAGYIPSLIGDESQTMAIEINRETDPLFNKLTPLPSTSSLTRLRKLVRESDSHVGLALSADGTALSVVEKNGEQLDQLETVLLLATYLSHQYRQKGLVIAPLLNREEPITMERLQAWQEATGLTVELTARSPERITEMLAQEQQPLLVGGTGQGQYVFGHYSRYPDALLAGLLIAEMIARRGGSLRPLLNDIRSRLYES
jgi:phosphomannomutase